MTVPRFAYGTFCFWFRYSAFPGDQNAPQLQQESICEAIGARPGGPFPKNISLMPRWQPLSPGRGGLPPDSLPLVITQSH
jgi:hypothetical protein